MTQLNRIEGIGKSMETKLVAAGVLSIEGLLKVAGTKAGRQKLADAAGINSARILKWVNHADLMRVKGIGGQYSELLEAAGVDSIPELARRNAESLHAKMLQINDSKNLVRLVASLKSVRNWVAYAKILPRAVHH